MNIVYRRILEHEDFIVKHTNSFESIVPTFSILSDSRAQVFIKLGMLIENIYNKIKNLSEKSIDIVVGFKGIDLDECVIAHTNKYDVKTYIGYFAIGSCS